jgi:hypothetical protein
MMRLENGDIGIPLVVGRREPNHATAYAQENVDPRLGLGTSGTCY